MYGGFDNFSVVSSIGRSISKKNIFTLINNGESLRDFIHISDVVDAFVFAINNFKKLKGNTFNLGLSSANLTKYSLAKLIQKQHKKLEITQIKNKSDPDKRDYFVSNKKIEKAGFKATFSLESGISELIKIFKFSDVKFKNNY